MHLRLVSQQAPEILWVGRQQDCGISIGDRGRRNEGIDPVVGTRPEPQASGATSRRFVGRFENRSSSFEYSENPVHLRVTGAIAGRALDENGSRHRDVSSMVDDPA
jgi:hypothetical protein